MERLTNEMIRSLLLVGAGSAVGGILRWLLSMWLKWGGRGFPWATFAVNILGCLLIGLLWGWGNRSLSPQLMLLLSVGLCGGFTTFSTFSKESLILLQGGNYLMFALYVGGSIAFGIGATAIGWLLAK